MEYTHLGRTSARVSRLCLGTMNFGPVIDTTASHAILDRAFAGGVNFIDCADVYGSGPFGTYYGQSEEVLGEWVANQPREQIVLATKVHGPMGSGPNDEGLSAVHIRHAVDASLRRLRTDYIDLYQMHHIVPGASVDEIWEAFSVLRQQGKALYFGSSNFPGWNIAQYQEAAASRHVLGLVSEQSVYNLTQRAIEQEVLPAATHYGLAVLPWSPLGGGLLGGILQKSYHARTASKLETLSPELRTRIERYEAHAREWNIAPGVLALAWLLHQPGVTAPVVGPRTPGQLDDAFAALDTALSPEQLQTLDELWPAPGRAPEGYAW